MTQELPEVGPWAREKLAGLRAYLSAYMTILSKHAPLRTVYVDAFAAAGRALVRKKEHDDPTIHLDLGDEARDDDSREVIDGSARVALEIEPPFEQYVFIETDERRLAQLKELEAQYGAKRKIAVRSGDCNTYLTTKLLTALGSDSRWRGVVFLDPFGMQVPWSTIKRLADTKQVEVFVNFPVGMAIQRLLPRNAHFTAKARAKLDLYFGDPGGIANGSSPRSGTSRWRASSRTRRAGTSTTSSSQARIRPGRRSRATSSGRRGPSRRAGLGDDHPTRIQRDGQCAV